MICLDELIKQTAEKTSLHMKISLSEIKDEAQLKRKLPSMHTALDWFLALHQPCMEVDTFNLSALEMTTEGSGVHGYWLHRVS